MDSQAQQTLNSIKSDVTELISKQRLLRLVEGGKFLRYTAKGQRVKDKYWLCKLSSNHRTLHYSNLDDQKDPSYDDLPNSINVRDIKRIIIGKDCPHMRDGHIKKTVDLAFSIVYESDHDDYLNFVAIDKKTFCTWTDGLDALLGHPMSSDEYRKDLQTLTKIEIKLRSIAC